MPFTACLFPFSPIGGEGWDEGAVGADDMTATLSSGAVTGAPVSWTAVALHRLSERPITSTLRLKAPEGWRTPRPRGPPRRWSRRSLGRACPNGAASLSPRLPSHRGHLGCGWRRETTLKALQPADRVRGHRPSTAGESFTESCSTESWAGMILCPMIL